MTATTACREVIQPVRMLRSAPAWLLGALDRSGVSCPRTPIHEPRANHLAEVTERLQLQEAVSRSAAFPEATTLMAVITKSALSMN